MAAMDVSAAAVEEKVAPETAVTTGETDEAAEGTTLHVSAKDFVRCPVEKVETWMATTGGIGIKKCFKMKQWGYCFVTVACKEDAEKFKEAVDGKTFRNSPVQVKEGKARAANAKRPRGPEEEAAMKKKKVKEFKEGYVPTLRDIKEKEKSHKGAGIEKTVVQKSAPLLEYDYETQLNMKETSVKTAIRDFTKKAKAKTEENGTTVPWTDTEWQLRTKAPCHCGCPLDPIIGTPADKMEGYRNKCEFSIGHNAAGEVEVGFVLRVDNDLSQVLDGPHSIPHVPAAMKRLSEVVKSAVKESSFPIFDRRRGFKTGVWRLVMVRQSPNGSMLVMVQTASVPEEKREELMRPLIDALVAADLGVKSVYLQLNDQVSDAPLPGAPLIHMHGDERLVMPLMGLNFEIGPLSFFQTNIVTCELLYSKALSWLRPERTLMLDVCCGVGTIGLCLAKECKKVVGIELVPEAAQSARDNAKLNGIENATYHAGKAEEVLPAILDGEIAAVGSDCEVCAVVDPPRPGLHKDVLQALRDCKQLTRIVYISCNPESLADDVVKLTTVRDGDDPFMPVKAVAVDMFPHTLHCEMILLLERTSKTTPPPALPPREDRKLAKDAASGPDAGVTAEPATANATESA